MDEAFLIRAWRLLGDSRRPRLSHESLIAQISDRQASSPTARLASGFVNDMPRSNEPDSAVTLVTGGEGWRGARAAQDGCFNRAVAARRLNTP